MSFKNVCVKISMILAVVFQTAACHGTENLENYSWNQGVNVIPAPLKLEEGTGRFFLESGMKIYAPDEATEKMLAVFVDKINRSTGLELGISSVPEECSILLELSPIPSGLEKTFVQEEAYQMEVLPDRVRIKAGRVHGLYNAMATFLQLLPAEVDSPVRVRADSWSLPCVRIDDAPRFAYRGIMLDVARHFLSKEEVLEQIEVFASLKINRLHLHLSDNQGWRIEIKAYPELTQKGSVRTESDGSLHSGFYTQEDIREIVAFAADRFITVVPEIDIPAHSQAMNVCLPHLSCTGKVTDVRAIWGPDHLVLCPGKEDMFEFMDKVYAELVELFPSEYFHVGGDECPKDNWKECPWCQKRIREEKLQGDARYTAEEKLQSYTICRMEKILASYGKKMIGWDEILQGGVSPSATVMSWQDEKGGIAAASKGNHVIMTPNDKGLYFNYFQGNSKVEPVCFGNYAPLKKVYAYEPVPAVLEEKGWGHFVQGVQANLWSEYLYEADQWEYALYPRTMALAELAWTPEKQKDFGSLCRRLENSLKRLEMKGIVFHIPLPEMVGGPKSTVAFTDSLQVAFTTTRPVKMVYTLDGKEPDVCSAVYDAPLTFHSDATLKIASVMENGAMSRVLTYQIRKQVPAPAVILEQSLLEDGLRVAVQKGSEVEHLAISSLDELTHGPSRDKSIDSVEVFTSVAEGYLQIPSDDVYVFSTNYDEFWLDGELVIDNRGEVKRWSRKDNSKALAAGLHKVKIVFRSEFIGGWPSFWDNGNIQYRKGLQGRWKTISPDMLTYEK